MPFEKWVKTIGLLSKALSLEKEIRREYLHFEKNIILNKNVRNRTR